MRRADILLVLPSRMSSIGELEGFVEDVIAEQGFGADLQGNLLISLTEAVTNAVRHGNKLDADKHVRVEMWRMRDRLKVVVTDEGAGFKPSTIPDPTSPAFLEQEGGRGVFLMRALTDDIQFCADGRCVEMYYDFAVQELGQLVASARGESSAIRA